MSNQSNLAFNELALPIQKWIRSENWSELRKIQVDTIRAISTGVSDLIISASTAGGKTEAAFLPLISQVLHQESEEAGFDLLYIGPLKALITDQARRLEEMCEHCDLPVVPWHGDISAGIKAKALKKPKGILLITPESLEALFVLRGLEMSRLFSKTKAVVIDELHSVLDSERGIQMRSLLARLELTVGHRIQRVGLSATLGDMNLTRQYLRPEAPDKVELIVDEGGGSELQLQLRGYITDIDINGDIGDELVNSGQSTVEAISKHLFDNLRGNDNLIFAGSRARVEVYADNLRDLCETSHLPLEFYPHHASLSRDHRSFVEQRLKERNKPTSAICTSTLELGIDIGDVTCVAQIGAPFSVASLRQRLGRSGRRAGMPAILRQYVIESKLETNSHFSDTIRLGLIRSIAMIELLLEKWCEPPKPAALHLSTLVHQILSIIAEKGGASATRLFVTLCEKGPFKEIDQATFLDVLRSLGEPDTALIEQTDAGLLLLGKTGEKIVEHYSFYAVFKTPDEYRLVSNGKELGTMPVENIVTPGTLLIFSGRRWLVQEIEQEGRVIMVTPAKGGIPPRFGGETGAIHNNVITRMFELLEGNHNPVYLDNCARDLLIEARKNYKRFPFNSKRIAEIGEYTFILATRRGTVETNTLALALRGKGYIVQAHDGFLEVMSNASIADVRTALQELATGSSADLFSIPTDLVSEKFHPFLNQELLRKDALSSRFDSDCIIKLCEDLLGQKAKES